MSTPDRPRAAHPRTLWTLAVLAAGALLLPGAATDAAQRAAALPETQEREAAPGELWFLSGRTGNVLSRLTSGEPGDEFGSSISRDVAPRDSADATTTMVGAPGTEFEGTPRVGGTVYGFDPETEQIVLAVEAGDLPGRPVSRFGHSLLDLGHVDDDRSVHWAVGAPSLTERRTARPAVVFLHARDGELVQRGRRTAKRRSLYGWDIASMGIDREGGSHLEGIAVTAPAWKLGPLDHVGAVEALRAESGDPLWRVFGEGEHEHFGYSVALLFDRDEDGWPEILVGAPATEVDDLVDAGSVFVLSGVDGEILLRIDGQRREGWFGAVANVVVDQNEDGLNDLAIVSLMRGERPRPRHQRGHGAIHALPTGERIWSRLGGRREDRLGARVFRSFTVADIDGFFDFAVSVTRAEPIFLPE